MKRLPRLSKSGILTPSQWDAVARVIESNLREVTLQPGVGYTLNSGPGGQSLVVNGGGGSSSTQAAKLPWDITLTPTETAGSYLATIWPATVNGLIAENAFDSFPVTDTGLYYVVATATTDGSVVSGIAISIVSSPPDSQLPATNALPSTVNIIVGVIKDGKAYNIAKANKQLTPYYLSRANGDFSGIWATN